MTVVPAHLALLPASFNTFMDAHDGNYPEIHNALFSPWRIAFGVGLDRQQSSSDDSQSDAARSQTTSPIRRTSLQRLPSHISKLLESSGISESSWLKKNVGVSKKSDLVKATSDAKPSKPVGELPEGFMLDIILKEGRDLVVRDSCGTSDPYVKFKIGDKQFYRSRTVFRNLNPKWNEKFSIPIPDTSTAVRVKVMDYDRGLVRDDSMGEATIEPDQLEQNVPTELKLHLADKKSKQTPQSTTYMGYIILQCTLVPDTGSQLGKYFRSVGKQASTDSTKKARTPLRSGVVTIILIEGKSLVAMDDNGLSDPYVRFQLGKERYKTKIKPKTLNPKWLEQFDLYLYDNKDPKLDISVFDHDVGGRDDIMGRAAINISQLEAEKTHLIEQQLEDGAGTIVMLITISGTRAKQSGSGIHVSDRMDVMRKYGLLKSFENFGDVGWLQVKVLRAKGLAAADFGGKSDPFCVLELANNRLQTHTEYGTLAPEWVKKFTFDVTDIHSLLEVSVYDEDHDKKVDFLGRVVIPLLRIVNGERRWYMLKDKKLCQVAKGAIELEMYFVYNHFKAAARTFSPRERKILHPEPRFKVTTMKHNINRMAKVIGAIVELSQFIQSCFDWDSKVRSCLAFVVFVIVVLNFEMYMLPLTLLIILLKNLFLLQLVKKLTKNKGDEEVTDEDDDDEDDEKEEKGETKGRSFREKLQSIQDACLQLQEAMDTVASFNERIKNVFTWTVPWLSMLAITILMTTVIILYYISLKYVLVLWGINKFTKKLRNPNVKTNNEILDFLSRVPSDQELHLYRELKITNKSGR